MRLIELEVGTWFRSRRWSDNAVAVLIAEPKAMHGLAEILVYRRSPPTVAEFCRGLNPMKCRLATPKEMEADDWEPVDPPDWVEAPVELH